MIEEAIIALTADRRIAIFINETNFDKNDEKVRPSGWSDLRSRRVLARERVDRLVGVSNDKIMGLHDERIRKVTSYSLPFSFHLVSGVA